MWLIVSFSGQSLEGKSKTSGVISVITGISLIGAVLLTGDMINIMWGYALVYSIYGIITAMIAWWKRAVLDIDKALEK